VNTSWRVRPCPDPSPEPEVSYPRVTVKDRDGIPSPSAHDRERNSHRSGIAWSKSAIRAILNNPRYTGRQVWNRQRKDEVLIDVNGRQC
jgi:hypothetical protein